MPTLTDAQIEDFRQLCGDECSPEIVSDERIQSFYDQSYSESDDAEEVEARTCVRILKRLLGVASTKIDKSGEFQTEKHGDIFDNTLVLLKYYQGIAGLGGEGYLSTGSLNLNIAADPNDLEYEI